MINRKIYQTAVDSYEDVRTLVRGLPYQCPDDWEEVLDSLDEDSNLYLIKEPDNPKDKYAIAAYLKDRRVGYVASSDCGKIWLFLTDEQMPCKFIQRYDASFKISFENPRSQFEDIPFKDIYTDIYGISDEPIPVFEIPFLNNPKDNHYTWFDDRILIGDFEKAIPDFRRKLATRMIIITGRKNSEGEYCYYLPYCNRPIADIEDDTVRNLVEKYGFVIALPDVPSITQQGLIIMDLHVTYVKRSNFKVFDSEHQSEFVFHLIREADYNSQETVLAQLDNESDKDSRNIQESILAMQDIYGQEHQPASYDYQKDSILKVSETIDYSVNNDYFVEIDIITTELYTFVREYLIQSIELFTYLKNHTPYALQFFNFDEFETLMKVFVLKDLGRIYAMLNHSINYDTAEGKAIFLYMAKEAGGNPELSYEMFGELCNPETRIKAASDMREVIENLMVSYYEYDIDLWTDKDFTIHSFLTEVDKNMSQRYMKLMRQFASAVAGANEQASNLSTHKFDYSKTEEKTSFNLNHEEEYYSVTDLPEGGKHVSMGVIMPEDGDENFDFCGETLFKQASEEAMDYIEEITESTADYKLEGKIINAVNDYLNGKSKEPYKVLVIPRNGYAVYTTLKGKEIAVAFDYEIQQLAEDNKGVVGYITDFEYDDDEINVEFTIRVSRSIPRL